MKEHKSTPEERSGLRRSFFIGFLMTLILCCFFLFAGVALENTAAIMYGQDTSLIEIQPINEDGTRQRVKVLGTEYQLDTSMANQAVKLAQENYPALPAPVRLVLYLAEGIKRAASLF